jgi:hypothetical protein
MTTFFRHEKNVVGRIFYGFYNYPELKPFQKSDKNSIKFSLFSFSLHNDRHFDCSLLSHKHSQTQIHFVP